jgi:hypothetical protein
MEAARCDTQLRDADVGGSATQTSGGRQLCPWWEVAARWKTMEEGECCRGLEGVGVARGSTQGALAGRMR